MTLGSEGAISDLSCLECNDHVGSRTKHCKVTSNGGRERYLQPVIWSCIREGGGKHLNDRNVGSNIGQNGNNHDEPVHACSLRHLLGTISHANVEKCLWNTGIVERTNEKELSDEKHQQTIIDLGQSSLGLGDKLIFLWLNLISIHIISFLSWNGIAFSIILCGIRARIIVLAFVRCNNHKNSSCRNRNDAHIQTNSKTNQENDNNKYLKLRPESPP
mmetsp:Transcript_16511/g.40342  ORF Transcript_16511/g.40342 Transcript_16511/m.40342 type:complete len:217 (+) Transcript_16511:187-837(+)